MIASIARSPGDSVCFAIRCGEPAESLVQKHSWKARQLGLESGHGKWRQVTRCVVMLCTASMFMWTRSLTPSPTLFCQPSTRPEEVSDLHCNLASFGIIFFEFTIFTAFCIRKLTWNFGLKKAGTLLVELFPIAFEVPSVHSISSSWHGLQLIQLLREIDRVRLEMKILELTNWPWNSNQIKWMTRMTRMTLLLWTQSPPPWLPRPGRCSCLGVYRRVLVRECNVGNSPQGQISQIESERFPRIN